MTIPLEPWLQQTALELENRSQLYKEQELKNYFVPFLRNLLTKLPSLPASDQELVSLQQKIEELVSLIPPTYDVKSKEYRVYLSKVDSLKSKLKERFKLVRKGHYKTIWLPLGIAIGLPWGAAFKNIAMGIPIGLCLGLFIGSYLDSKAEKEGRVI
ncbi:hypothetical protein [Rufibacter roseus]|uniref:Glycine zipper-like domain-containing protein n=1 Tax=Rufibacter roseus TaxID=1567108 RepID=A0ABW2DIK4_9BACT|nr:hypothetical protein [Rufibacter roseus]